MGTTGNNSVDEIADTLKNFLYLPIPKYRIEEYLKGNPRLLLEFIDEETKSGYDKENIKETLKLWD